MSSEELRSLVVELVEREAAARPDTLSDDDPASEFDTQVTTFQPAKARTSTLDQLITWLRTTPPPLPREALRPKSRRRV